MSKRFTKEQIEELSREHENAPLELLLGERTGEFYSPDDLFLRDDGMIEVLRRKRGEVDLMGFYAHEAECERQVALSDSHWANDDLSFVYINRDHTVKEKGGKSFGGLAVFIRWGLSPDLTSNRPILTSRTSTLMAPTLV